MNFEVPEKFHNKILKRVHNSKCFLIHPSTNLPIQDCIEYMEDISEFNVSSMGGSDLNVALQKTIDSFFHLNTTSTLLTAYKEHPYLYLSSSNPVYTNIHPTKKHKKKIHTPLSYHECLKLAATIKPLKRHKSSTNPY